MKLYVGNLTHTTTAIELEKLFARHGAVKSVQIITDHVTRHSKCFGYVEMVCKKEASKALEMLHGKAVNKKPLIVKKARSRDERQGHPW